VTGRRGNGRRNDRHNGAAGDISKTTVTLRPDGHYVLGVGTSEFGNGTTTVHTQIVSTVLGTGVDRMTMTNSDTDGAVYGQLRDVNRQPLAR